MSVWAGRRAGVLGCSLLLAACGGAASGDEPEEEVAPDSVLAEALVLLHLADARAEATGESADSLRAAAYALARAQTGLDSAAIAERLHAAVARPEEAAALYERVTERLEAERR